MNVAPSVGMVMGRIALSRSGRGSAGVDTLYTCAAGVAAGEAVYSSAANTVAEANATDTTKAPAIGLVYEKTSTTQARVRSWGPVTVAGPLTPGATYYLSTTDGGITSTPPSGVDDVIQKVGFAVDSTTLFVQCTRETSRGPDGSADAPTYGFEGATGLGMYRAATQALGFASNGVLVLGIEATLLTITQDVALSGTTPRFVATGTNQGIDFQPNGTGGLRLRNAANTATILGVQTVASGNAGPTLRYGTSAATPGSATLNVPMGRAAFAAAGASVVITNDLVDTTSVVDVQLEGAPDATLTSVEVTPGVGSFTVAGNAAATAAKVFSFKVFNPST